MRELGRNMRASGRMIYGMGRVPILLVFPPKSSSRATGNEEFSTVKPKLSIKIEIGFWECSKTGGKMEGVKLFMGMAHISKANSETISRQGEERCHIEMREE